MINQLPLKGKERRQKRMLTSIIYFLAEIIALWLSLSLIQLEFYVSSWAIWAKVLFLLGVLYGFIKTVHIYRRQKDYKKMRLF